MNSRAMNKYKINPRRLAELRNFAYQYHDWIEALEEITEISAVNNDGLPRGTETSDPTARLASQRERWRDNIRLVDKCIEGCSKDEAVRMCVRIAVTTPRTSFAKLKARGLTYFERDTYYLALRRCYWLMDLEKM